MNLYSHFVTNLETFTKSLGEADNYEDVVIVIVVGLVSMEVVLVVWDNGI